MASSVKVWITRCLDEEGRRVTAKTPGAWKVRQRSKKWYARFSDASRKTKRIQLANSAQAVGRAHRDTRVTARGTPARPRWPPTPRSSGRCWPPPPG